MKFASEFWKPINILNLSIGILGLVFGFYFYKASQPSVRAAYVLNTELIARLEDPTFTLSKDGVSLPVRSLYRTTVAIWNAGTAPIEKGSVRRPLTIEFSPSAKVIDANIVKVSHNVSAPTLTRDASKVELDWKYFDPNFYFVIQFYHSTAEPPQISLRYIGDQEVAAQVPRAITESGYMVILFFVGFVGFMLVLFSAMWAGTKMEDYVKGRGEMSFRKWKLSSDNIGFSVFGIILLVVVGSVFMLGTFGEILPMARVGFGVTVPLGVSEFVPIDQLKSTAK